MKDQLTGSTPSNLGYGNRPVDLKPEEDFSAEAAAKREQARQIDFTDSKRQTNLKIERLNAEPVGYMGYGGVSHRNIALGYFHDQARSLVDRENRRRDIPDFVNLPGVKTLVEQAKAGGVDLTTEQIAQLADFGVLNAAADRIIAAAKANNGAGDPIGMMNVYTTLDSNNPVMAQILPSVVEAKLKEIAEDPTWVSQQLEKIGGVVNWVLTPLIAANNWTMEGVRAGAWQIEEDVKTKPYTLSLVSWAHGFFSGPDRAQVQAGMLNENYIQQLSTAKNPDGTPKYTSKQIDIARDVFVESVTGNPDAILSVWREKFAGDEEAAPIFRDIMYSRSTGTTQELLRQIDSAHLGNTGQVTFSAVESTPEYDPARGGELRQDLANVAGVGVSIALDPTLLLGRAGKAMKAVLWGIERLAPGVPAAEVLSKARFGRLSVTTPAYRYFDTLAKYLNKLESLDQTAVRAGRAATEASDDATRNAALARKLRAEQDAASLRQRMSRQFDELPDDLIDEFRASPWRNADGKFDVEHIAAHIDDVNDAYVTSMGDVSEKIAAAGATRAELFQAALDINADNFASPAAKAVIKGDLADAIRAENMLKLEAQNLRSIDQRIAARTQGRTALVPRLSVVGRARIAAVNQFAMLLMPQDKAFRLVDEYLRSSGDPATFGEALVANDIAFGLANRRFKFSADGFGDSVGRLFSSIASSRRFNIATGEDSLQVYRYSRSFFPKRTSELIADMYRRADPGARREIVIGLVRSAMASRGLTMTYKDAEEVLFGLKSSADQVMTGSRVGEQYAVSVPVDLLPSQKSALQEQSAIARNVPDAWVGGPKLYHGTSRRFPDDALSPVDSLPQENNFVGAGFYTTAERKVAESGYTKKGSGANPYLYSAQWTGRTSGRSTPNVLDGDLPAPDVLRATISGWVTGNGYLVDSLASNAPIFAALANPKTSTVDMFRSFRQSLAEYSDRRLTGPEVGELIQDINFFMVDDGIDAIKHVGGKYTGKSMGEHDVYIWLNTEDIAIADAGFGGVQSNALTTAGVWKSLSADADGMEHAIHLSQTADSVVVPSIRDMERMRNGVRVAFGNGAERVTNMWSLGTLFGLRFSIRNAIEEIGLYWLLGGRAIDLYRGRKLDQAIRKVRPMLSVVDGPSGPEVGYQKSLLGSDVTALGMVASRAQRLSRWMQDKGLPEWMAEMIYRPLDEDAIKAAGIALSQGDTEAFARLAIKSLATQRVFGLRTNLTSEQDRVAFSYLVDSTHGMALLDEIGEAGTYLQSGGYPAYVDNLYGIGEAEPGVEFGKLPQVKFGAYTNIPAKGRDNGVDIYGLGFWWRELQTTLDGDGPIGAAAVAGLQNPAAAKAKIARIIREDTEFGYKEKFSRIRGQWVTQNGKRVYVDDGSIDSFANSYFENVFQHFTRADGSLNTDLQAKFLVTDPETGKVTASWWKLLEPKDIEDLSPAEKQLAKQWVSPRVSRASLAELDVADRPDYIFGREVIKYVPNAANETALLGDRAFAWMGRQNARISRDPLFLANYLDQYRKTLGQRESFAMALAKKREERRDPDVVVSEETLAKEREADMLLAEKVYANQAMDSAFSLTLAYLDNPANRSNLAWKVRNVSRYYRATEDFYRRMKRVVQHDPLALWKGALTYHLLQENGFTYTNDKGEEYFAYPLNNLATGAVIKALGLFNLDVRQYADLNPFSLNGRVTGLTPSLDPNQGVMTLSGPLAAPVAGILSAFPTLAGLRAVLLGKYNRATGNAFADMVQTFIPAGVSKMISASDAERIDTQISSAAFDTVALMTAEGMLDVLTINGKPLDIEPSRVDFTQFSKTDQYQAAQKISASYFFTRLLFSYLAPANPLQQGDTASEFAKQNGIDTIDDAYYDLLDMYKDDPNGLQLALADFYAAKIPSMNGNYDGWDSLLPFTTSSTKFDELSHPAAAMASVRATDDVAKWLKSDETQDLFTRFGDVAWFVAPHTGAFDSTTHTLLTTTLGLKVPKAEAERYMELFALQGRAVEMKIRRDFSEEIAATTDPDELAALNEEKKMMIEANRQINPQWGIQVTTVDPSRNPLLTADLLSKTVSMLAYLREKNGSLTADQQMIANAILTYTEYKSDVEGLKGTVQQKQATKKWLAQNYETDLDVIRNESENAALFIDGVLSTDPNYLYGME